jgi:hypothetical protein
LNAAGENYLRYFESAFVDIANTVNHNSYRTNWED